MKFDHWGSNIQLQGKWIDLMKGQNNEYKIIGHHMKQYKLCENKLTIYNWLEELQLFQYLPYPKTPIYAP